MTEDAKSADGESAAAIGRAVRALIRGCDRAALATALDRDGEAWPYGSLVLTACDAGGAPLLLLSDLAEHSRNIAGDDRVSLLFDGTAGLDEPLTGARATVLGHARRDDGAGARARYLARHPSAAGYADFGDFHFYRVEPDSAHLVAGFGRIHWIDGAALRDPTDAAALSAAEAEIVDHMNADHADALALYATVLLGLEAGDWRMTGIDPEGFDLRAGGRVARVAFERPVVDAAAARAELVRLVKQARAQEG